MRNVPGRVLLIERCLEALSVSHEIKPPQTGKRLVTQRKINLNLKSRETTFVLTLTRFQKIAGAHRASAWAHTCHFPHLPRTWCNPVISMIPDPQPSSPMAESWQSSHWFTMHPRLQGRGAVIGSSTQNQAEQTGPRQAPPHSTFFHKPSTALPLTPSFPWDHMVPIVMGNVEDVIIDVKWERGH